MNDSKLLAHFREIEACIKAAPPRYPPPGVPQGDAWDSLRALYEHYQIYELIAAEDAMSKVPEKARRFYKPNWGTEATVQKGKFVGLVCTSCDAWRHAGHKGNCPVKALEEILE